MANLPRSYHVLVLSWGYVYVEHTHIQHSGWLRVQAFDCGSRKQFVLVFLHTDIVECLLKTEFLFDKR